MLAAWRDGDAVRSAAFFAHDGVYREARGAAFEGREAIVRHFTTFFRDGPRFEFHVDDVLVEEARGAVRFRFAIVDDGGRRVERDGCAFVTFRDGTVAQWREYEG